MRNDIPPVNHPYRLTRVFHEAFNHPVRETPAVPSARERLLRVKLILSEAMEFAEASGFPVEIRFEPPKGTMPFEMGMLPDDGMIPLEHAIPEMDRPKTVNIVEAADGLGDLNVVVNGGMLIWGFPAHAIDREVFTSNMSKLGPDGRPIEAADGKIMKGPSFRKPDIRRVLLDHGWKE